MSSWRPLFAATTSITPLERWLTELLHCPRCDWAGIFKHGEVSWHEDMVNSYCPRCGRGPGGDQLLAMLVLPEGTTDPVASGVWDWFMAVANPEEPEEPIIQWPGDDPEGDQEVRDWLAAEAADSVDKAHEYSFEDVAAELRGQSSDDFSEINDWNEDGEEIVVEDEASEDLEEEMGMDETWPLDDTEDR